MSVRLTASSASKFIACHAAGNLEVAIPGWVPPVEDPHANTAANRGTILHEHFAALMHLAPVDAENFAAALTYVADLRKGRRFKAVIEQPMVAEWLASKPTTTADLVLYVGDELHILDLKTGKIPVDPVGNSQLLYYAATYGHLAPKAPGAHLHIVQPWAGITESWFATAQEIADFMVEAQQAEAAINGGSTVFNPGDHCTFCPANPRARTAKGAPLCPTLMQMYYPRIDLDEAAILQD